MMMTTVIIKFTIQSKDASTHIYSGYLRKMGGTALYMPLTTAFFRDLIGGVVGNEYVVVFQKVEEKEKIRQIRMRDRIFEDLQKKYSLFYSLRILYDENPYLTISGRLAKSGGQYYALVKFIDRISEKNNFVAEFTVTVLDKRKKELVDL